MVHQGVIVDGKEKKFEGWFWGSPKFQPGGNTLRSYSFRSRRNPCKCDDLEIWWRHCFKQEGLINYFKCYLYIRGFLGSSAGKEFICNAGDPNSIPRSRRSPGEGIGYPLQYSWASLVAQMVKNPPAMWETWVPSLGWEDSLKEGLGGMATHSSILAWRIPIDRGAWQSTVHGASESQTCWATKHSTVQEITFQRALRNFSRRKGKELGCVVIFATKGR